MSQIDRPVVLDSPLGSGAVYGQPRVWLRLEAAAAMCLATGFYARGGHSWVLFGVLFFAPDISFIAYLAGPRIGAICYNFAHSYVAPVAIGVALHALGISMAVPLIWIAHIGFDRAIGYGLKYPSGFGHTHLGFSGTRAAVVLR